MVWETPKTEMFEKSFEMLSFEEFKAVEKRETARTKKDSQSGSAPAKQAVPAKSGNEEEFPLPNVAKQAVKEPSKSVNIFKRISSYVGGVVEQQGIQSLCFVLIVLDTFLSFAVVHGKNAVGSLDDESMLLAYSPALFRAHSTLSAFLLILFSAEILANIVGFGLFAVLFHLGYAMDIMILCLQAYGDATGTLAWSRLLNILRFWRILRIVSTVLNEEKDKHDDTRQQLETVMKDLRKQQQELEVVRNDLKREKVIDVMSLC